MIKPLITIIIATYNSAGKLPLVLDSINKQSISRSKIEILIVDGGSKDKTLEIANKYKCIVINNYKTEPVFAKYLGYIEAKGKYIVYLDHDEVFFNKDSLKIKFNIFNKFDSVKAIIGSGYKNPPGYPFINNYINEFGDPFSFFIYRLSKDERFFTNEMRKRYPISKENNNSLIFKVKNLNPLPIIELCAVGSMINAEYFKTNFPHTLQNSNLIPHFFYLLTDTDQSLALTKEDYLIHYSSENLKQYLNKINWRIKNNIYFSKKLGTAGFGGRTKYSNKMEQFRKYLFIPYNFILIPVLIDAIYLSYTRRNINYIYHIPLSIYTALLIIYHYLAKSLGVKQKLKSYDEKTVINSE